MEPPPVQRMAIDRWKLYDLWTTCSVDLYSIASDPAFDPHTALTLSNDRTLLHAAADRALKFDVELCERLLNRTDIRVDHVDNFDRSALFLCWYARHLLKYCL